jgi:hypothetical protein
MNEDLRKHLEALGRAYGQKEAPVPWPRDAKGVLRRIPTPEWGPYGHQALQNLATFGQGKPIVLCQYCDCELRAWPSYKAHTCHVCKMVGRS